MTMGKASRRLAKKQHQQHQLQAKQEIEALRQQMRSCYEQQDYAGTINTLAAIVQAGAHDADDLYLGAYSYFMMGDYERTAKMVTTVLDLAPGHLEARLLLARLCIFQNRIDDGLAIYDFVLESYANALTEEQSEDIEDIHKTEPYVYCQMVAGKDAAIPGEGKNSWLTGTAAWTFTAMSQYILGIQPELDGLRINPCIPDSVDGYTLDRTFRGVKYHITVDNSAHVQKGVASMTVDGQPVDGNLIRPVAGKTDVQVVVRMGA